MRDYRAEKEIKEIISRWLDLRRHKLVLFGSRATGTARKFSDYDIAIEGKRSINFATMSNIRADLEESDIPYSVDVVDLKVTSSEFREVALIDAKRL